MADSLPRKNICPLLDKPCLGLDCKWYLQLVGTDPQDASKTIDGWDCAIVWQVQAQLDVRKAVTGGLDGVQKSVESFRNNSAEASQAMLKVSAAALGFTYGRNVKRLDHDQLGED